MVVVEKVIMCRLNINKIEDQFCADYSKMRLDKLNKQLVGYCYKGMLITDIISILKTSQIRTNTKSLDGHMHLDIMTRVRGIIYEPGEIIPDAKIIKIENSLITAFSNFARINIPLGTSPNILKVGDTTPIIVKLARYNIYTQKISIGGELFVPKIAKNIPIYLCKDDIKDIDDIDGIKDMKVLIDNYNNYFKELSGEKALSKKFFIDLIYPFQKPIELKKIENIDLEKVKILDYTPIKDKYLLILPGKLDDDFIYISKNKVVSPDIPVISTSNHNYILTTIDSISLIKIFLSEYIKNLHTLMQLIETYPDKESIKKSNHVWNYYNILKKK